MLVCELINLQFIHILCIWFLKEITATTAQAISSAKTRLEILVDSARPSLPWTHFVSIPLNTPVFIKKFESFKNQVMEQAHDVCNVL